MDLDDLTITEREGTVQRLIADYLQAEAAGHPPDRAELFARHPELADELRAFFADHDQVRQWAEPLCSATPAPAGRLAPLEPAEPEPGCRFGDYEILGEIARGGMGVVYKARQVSLDRLVALKMIRAGSLAGPADVQRFQTEAQAAAYLDHPNIVPIYEVGSHAGRHFFTMKLVPGGNLADALAAAGPPAASPDRRAAREHQDRAARLVATVARAVHYAHQRGIIHRDLKPANILLQRSAVRGQRSEVGGQRSEEETARSLSSDLCPLTSDLWPKITDFGLAKRLTDDSRQTQSGAILGTPSYMAPEQAAARPDISTAADVYSLGAILYELLTGRPPFRAESSLETLRQVIERDPPRPRSLNPRVDQDLETICLKCLEKAPEKRYGSAEALADDLERWQAGEPIQARPSTYWERAAKWGRRHPTLAGVTGVAAAALAALLVLNLVHGAQLQAALGDVESARKAVGEEKKAAADANRDARQARTKAQADEKRAAELEKRAAQLVQEADGLRLVGESRAVLADNPGLALLLAVEAAGRGPRRAAHNNALAAAWSACRERGPLLGPDPNRGAFTGALFFPDGRRILTIATQDLTIWDRQTGKVLIRLGVPPLSITSATLSPDGRYVAATFRDYWSALHRGGRRVLYTDQAVRLWDTGTGKETVLRGHENRVVSARFSPDGKRLVSASWDQTARVWDVATGKTLHVLKAHTCALAGADFSADGKGVYTLSSGRYGFSPVPGGEYPPAVQAVDEPIPAGGFWNIMVAGHGSSTGNGGNYRSGDIARLWDAATGKEQTILAGPERMWAYFGPPRTALSPDGKHLVVSLHKEFIWDIASGKMTPVGGPKRADRGLPPAFSPDGRLVLTSLGSHNQSLRILDAATGKEVGAVLGHSERITSARFAGNDRIITTSGDKTCRVWFCRRRESGFVLTGELMALRGHELDVLSADLAPDGETVLTASADGTARLWHVGEQEVLGRPQSAGDRTWCAAVSPAGRLVATGSFDGTIRLWDVRTGRLRATWQGHTSLGKDPMRRELLGEVIAMSFSPDGKKLLAVSADPAGYLHGRAVNGRWTPHGKTALGPHTPVRVWDVATGKELGLPGPHGVGVSSASFSPDGKRILTVADTRLEVRFFDDRTRVCNGRGTLSTDKDRAARVWDGATGRELLVLKGPWREIGTAVWSRDGTRIVTTHEDAVRIWNAADGREVRQLGGDRLISAALLSPDGRRLLTWPDPAVTRRGGHWHALPRRFDRQADLWDAATGRHVATLRGHLAPVNSAAFSPDGRWLVTTAEEPNSFTSSAPLGLHGRAEDTNCRDRTARIWDAATGKPLRVLRGHLRSVHSAAFGKAGKWLVTTSEDRTARLWDPATGRELFTLAGHRDAVRSAAFTPDGKFVVTTSWDGTARLWPTDPLEAARARRPRELTAEERQRYAVDAKPKAADR